MVIKKNKIDVYLLKLKYFILYCLIKNCVCVYIYMIEIIGVIKIWKYIYLVVKMGILRNEK